MAYIVSADQRDAPPLFVRSIGRKRVTWTPDRDKARRFRTWDAADKANKRARAEIGSATATHDGG
jgi:hypothetical protein